MTRGDRGIDSAFLGRHHLFCRCNSEDVLEDRLIAARIKYSNVSVNWSKYSKPWDAIFDHPDHGIVRFIVRWLPKELPKEKADERAKEYSFSPQHAPEDLNYSHSEIRTFRGAELMPKPKLPEIVKKEFRTVMSDRGYLIRLPRA